MMSQYCKTCGHHSTMHFFSAVGNKHGCTITNPDGNACVCTGFKKREASFGDRVRRYAEQQKARAQLKNPNLKRGPRGIGHLWSGKE